MGKGWLIGGGVFLGALLVASVIVALLNNEESFDEDTPEATVQRYLKGIESRDIQITFDLLSEDLKRDCTLEDFGGNFSPFRERLTNDRVSLERTTMLDGTAFVTVRISNFSRNGPFGISEPFGNSDSSYTQNYTLKQEDGTWKFSEFPSYPGHFFRCDTLPARPVVPPPPPPAERVEPRPTIQFDRTVEPASKEKE